MALETKVCFTCGIEKPRTDFPSSGWYKNADGSKSKAIKPQCKICFTERAKTQAAKNFARAGIEMRCARCGYDTCVGALDFHHRDPAQKDFNIATRWSISYEKFLAEVNKCVILCCRCHRELHAGLWKLGD